MTALLLRWFILPVALLLLPARSFGSAPVAVFDFQTDGNVDALVGGAHAGNNLSTLMAADLSDRPPLGAISGDVLRQRLGDRKVDLIGTLTTEEARRIGVAAGVAALVNGRIYAAGPEIIIAAKVVAVETGQTWGTMVRGPRATAMADLFSQLAGQIGQIVLRQQGMSLPPWPAATVVGTGKPGSIFTPGEVACVMGVDGRSVPDETRRWREPQALLPGRHQIHVRYANRTLVDCNFVVDVRPGAAYEVAYQLGPKRQVRLWIQEQASHRPVTRMVEATLPAMAATTDYYLPEVEPRLPTYH